MSSKLGEEPPAHPAFCSTRWMLTRHGSVRLTAAARALGQGALLLPRVFSLLQLPPPWVGVSYGLASSIYNSKFKILF